MPRIGTPFVEMIAVMAKGVQTQLRLKCGKCGCWNGFLVEKRAVEALMSEAKAKFLIRAYEPLKVEKCTNY